MTSQEGKDLQQGFKNIIEGNIKNLEFLMTNMPKFINSNLTKEEAIKQAEEIKASGLEENAQKMQADINKLKEDYVNTFK